MRRRGLFAVTVLAGFLGATTMASAATNLGCGSRGALVVTAKPRDCFLDWPNLSLAEAVGLRHITWSGWGRPTATARALVRTKVYDPWTHVRVRAFGRRRCVTTSLYTRVRVDFGRTTHTWRTPGCADVQDDS